LIFDGIFCPVRGLVDYTLFSGGSDEAAFWQIVLNFAVCVTFIILSQCYWFIF
jgi:hypothetical protein